MGVLSLPLWLRRENCAVAGEGAPIFVAGGGGLAAAADGFSVGWQKDGCHSHFWIKNGAVEWCAEQGLLWAAGEQARWPIAGNYFRAGTNGIIEVGCFSARPAGRPLSKRICRVEWYRRELKGASDVAFGSSSLVITIRPARSVYLRQRKVLATRRNSAAHLPHSFRAGRIARTEESGQ
jgi:hypothetical protein